MLLLIPVATIDTVRQFACKMLHPLIASFCNRSQNQAANTPLVTALMPFFTHGSLPRPTILRGNETLPMVPSLFWCVHSPIQRT